MDRLRLLWENIKTQLGELSASQRLAIGLCAALVFVSLLWLTQWSSAPEIVPLVTHDFTYDELDIAEQALDAAGIKYETRGTRIFVHPTQRYNALRIASSAGALPENSLLDMEAVVKDSNPFQAPAEREKAWNYAKGNELAKIITTYPFVKRSSVIINPTTKRRLGGTTDIPTASVSVTLIPGKEMSHDLVEGFARLVSGAVSGLKPHHVSVLDARTGRSHGLPDPDDVAGYDVLTMEKRREEHLHKKILGALTDIPGVQVAVTVKLNTNKTITRNTTHDKPQVKTEKTEESDQSTASQSAEPGVQANTGTGLTLGGGGRSNTKNKVNTENFPPNVSQVKTVEELPFAVTQVTAAVRLPRSYVVGVYMAQNPDITDNPKDDDTAFSAVRDAQISRIRSTVERIVMVSSGSEDVEVDVYPDMNWTAGGAPVWRGAPGGVVMADAAGESEGMMHLARTYGPQAGLMMLAFMSLFMMLRVARKSADVAMDVRRRSIEEAESDTGEEFLTVGTSAIGQADLSESLLAGKEVDPEMLRQHELGHEVSNMVKEDPEAAAELVRRWISDDE